jgi:DNA helicase-2/ATP-dependent DNA helicase PcrA
LRRRLQRDDLIPGLTVHQAKGREWPRVGVALSEKDEQTLAGGLQKLEPEHCVLYVALTRAKESCVALGDPGELQLADG